MKYFVGRRSGPQIVMRLLGKERIFDNQLESSMSNPWTTAARTEGLAVFAMGIQAVGRYDDRSQLAARSTMR